jgi:hypothetical protein
LFCIISHSFSHPLGLQQLVSMARHGLELSNQLVKYSQSLFNKTNVSVARHGLKLSSQRAHPLRQRPHLALMCHARLCQLLLQLCQLRS